MEGTIKRERMKCSVGISWSKETGMMGTGWIMRNSDRETLLHSRRALMVCHYC